MFVERGYGKIPRRRARTKVRVIHLQVKVIEEMKILTAWSMIPL